MKLMLSRDSQSQQGWAPYKSLQCKMSSERQLGESGGLPSGGGSQVGSLRISRGCSRERGREFEGSRDF